METRSGRAPEDRGRGLAADAQDPRAEEPVAAGVPLARIVPRQLVDSPEVFVRGVTRSPAAERIRRLRALLEHDENGPPQVIVVTSAAPREGKSLIALNLALTFAVDRKTDVLLVDADLRRPTVDRWMTPTSGVGLAEVLAGKAPVDHALLRIKDSTLQVLAAGRPPQDPVALLSSPAFPALIGALRERYRQIVVDTPPIVPFTDADVVGRAADGVLLVVREGQTPRSMCEQAVAAVTSTRILGAVLNDTVWNLADRDRYYGRYYDQYYGTGKRR